MFNEKLKQLFTLTALAAGYSLRTVATQRANPLVPLLPKPQVSRRYPRCSEGERVRRMSQILRGTHRVENGLIRNLQLINRPNGGLQIRWPYS